MLNYTEFNVFILFVDSLYTLSQKVDHPTDGDKFVMT